MIPFKFKSDISHLLLNTWNERSKLISNIYGTIANEMGSHPRLHKLFSSNSSWILMVQISQISLFRSKLRYFCQDHFTEILNDWGVTHMLIPGPLRLKFHGKFYSSPKCWKFPESAESRECGTLNWFSKMYLFWSFPTWIARFVLRFRYDDKEKLGFPW